MCLIGKRYAMVQAKVKERKRPEVSKLLQRLAEMFETIKQATSHTVRSPPFINIRLAVYYSVKHILFNVAKMV
jgi:arginyl-tRNA synthetase